MIIPERSVVRKQPTPKVSVTKVKATNEGIDIYTPKYNGAFNDSLKAAVFGWNKGWDKKKRCWWVKNDFVEAAIGVVIEHYPTAEFDETILNLVNRVKKQNKFSTATTVSEEDEISIHGGALYPFQSAGVRFLELKIAINGGIIIGDDMGCISGNAIIAINRAGKASKIKLRDLYKKFNGIEGRWNTDIPTYTKSLTDNELTLNRIKKVIYQGKKHVIEITTKSRKKLRLTPDHELFKKNGKEIEAANSLNKKILVNGKIVCKRCSGTENITTYKYSKYRGYCKQCIYRYLRKKPTFKGGKFIDKDGYIRVSGNFDHPREFNNGIVFEHILVMEKHLGRYIEWPEQIHHKNEIRHDNRIENLQLTSCSEHHILHNKHLNMHGGTAGTGGKITFLPKEDRVVSIRNIGERRVYDIVMEDPYRNFIANGIIVHNCGKTVQALAFIDRDYRRQPSLIVCPANVKLNWGRKIIEWINNDINCVVIEGGFFYKINKNGNKEKTKHSIEKLSTYQPDIVITNYDLLKRHKNFFRYYGFRTMILDESHYVKESKSGRSIAAREIAKNIPRRILMTGTPVLNRPRELWHQLHICDPQKWPKFTTFGYKYCNPEEKQIYNRVKDTFITIKKFDGASNLDELHRRVVGQYMIRRKKKDVLKDLPEKLVFRTTLDIKKEDRAEYDLAVKDFFKWAFEEGGIEKLNKAQAAEAITKLTTLKRLCALSKINSLIEYFNDWFESNEDEQLTIFAHHKDVVNRLEESIKKAGHSIVTIRGGDNSSKRQDAIDKFVAKEARVFLASIMAAGTGTDGLQVCQNMKVVERTWRPADMVQMEDRLWRINQRNNVMIEYLDMENSIDGKMAAIIAHKMKIINKIVDGSAADVGDISGDVLNSMFDKETA